MTTSTTADMRLVLIHPFDPRGLKVGGIETHVRQLIRRHPQDQRVLMVGVDDFGDLQLGTVHTIEVSGRSIDFLPITHVPSDEQTNAATSLARSVTLRFALALFRYQGIIRRLTRGERASAEIERFEFAPILRLLGLPFVLIAHNEGDPRTDKMDSILSRYWYINTVTERIAVSMASRVFGVTPRIRDRLSQRYPKAAGKIGVLSVSVDTELFHATPFDLSSDVLKIVYAGRLDEFKDPPTMFRVMQRLHALLNGKIEFHYCGSSDPHRFPEFAPIESYTVLHGALSPEQVAAVMRDIHIGTLVSHWEGMPCFLLELLASGRAFGGLRLPQFDLVVEPGMNGQMVDRAEDEGETVQRVADAIVRQWSDIKAGRVDPAEVHASILPWSVNSQLGRLFTALYDIARRGTPPKIPASANSVVKNA